MYVDLLGKEAEKMKLKFNPQEAFASIINTFATFIILANGGSADIAAASGAALEGAIKGIEYKEDIKNKINSVVISSIEEACDGEFAFCEEWRVALEELFSEDMIFSSYLLSDNPYEVFEKAIEEVCGRFDNCDNSTLPVKDIVNKIINVANAKILQDEYLLGLYTYFESRMARENIQSLQKHMQELLIVLKDRNNHLDSESNIKKRSKNSAKIIADAFKMILFSEQGLEKRKTLEDVYVDSEFESETGHFDTFKELYDSIDDEENILIEGDPGLGKSSLVMFVANEYCREKLFVGKTVFFIRGKDLRNSKGDPIQDIVEHIGLSQSAYLKNTIVFLDAYDEISFVSKSTDQNNAYHRQLELDFPGEKLIITSRPDYIRGFCGTRVKIQRFSPKQREIFLDKYNSGKSIQEKLKEDFINSLTLDDDLYENGIEEIISIPMLLYLIAVNNIDISEISDKYALYEKVFGTQTRDGAIKRNRKITQNIWNQLYKLAMNIAHYMYMNGELYIENEQVINLIDNMHLGPVDTEILKNRFGIEIYLKGSEDRLFTYIHTSIYEFFAAKYICDELKGVFGRYLCNTEYDIHSVIVALNKIFNAKIFSPNIFLYIMENIQAGCFDFLFEKSIQVLYQLMKLLNQLLSTQIYQGNITDVPYIILMKNMLLWVFNVFSVFFGRLEIDDEPYWVEVNQDIISFLINSLEPNDYLLLAHLKLNKFIMQKTDFKKCYFIDNDLTNADFSYSYCNEITVVGQRFDNMRMRSVDLYNIVLENCSFENTDLRFSDMRSGIFDKVSFKGADMRAVYLDDASFFSCNFEGAHICIEDFENVKLEKTSLKNAILYEGSDPDEDIVLG